MVQVRKRGVKPIVLRSYPKQVIPTKTTTGGWKRKPLQSWHIRPKKSLLSQTCAFASQCTCVKREKSLECATNSCIISGLCNVPDTPNTQKHIKPGQHYHWVGDDKSHPAHKQESAEDDRGHVLQHGVHWSLWAQDGPSRSLLHVLWSSWRPFCWGTFNNVNDLRQRELC